MTDELIETLKQYGNKERVICEKCQGVGFTWEDIGYHKSEYKKFLCPDCKGDKTLIRVTFSYDGTFRENSDIVKKSGIPNMNDEILHELIAKEAKELLRDG